MKKRAHIEFFGNVQGTGYRFFIKQKAITLGLKGYCRLNSQNKIEVDVEGKAQSIEEFLKFVQNGVSPQANLNAFTIEIFDECIGYSSMETDIL